jgi:SAM-dependent methyltransferase
MSATRTRERGRSLCAMSGDAEMTAAQWDARYESEPELWTKEPNAPLAQLAGELEPGRALDVGAGDGRNAIWLATQGWTVTAIDLSAVALQRAGERAAARDTHVECIVADWHEHDFGEEAFELVVVSFMHPRPDDREALFERVARALVPGGHAFVVGVVLADHGRRGPPDAERLYTPERVRRALRGLEVVRCEEHAYEQDHSTGRRLVTDVVAVGRRL